MSYKPKSKNQGKRKPKQGQPDRIKHGEGSKGKTSNAKNKNNEWDDPEANDSVMGTTGTSDSMRDPLVFESDASK